MNNVEREKERIEEEEEQMWKTVQKQRTLNVYKEYLKKYSKGKYAEEARSKVDLIEKLPVAPDDDKFDFYVFDTPMLINREHIKEDENIGGDWYGKKNFLYGIITYVDDEFTYFKVKIIRMGNKDGYWRDLTGEEWKVWFDEVYFGGENEMCHACASNFKSLMEPGRRLKFSMVEGYPGGGTLMNGVWVLTYAEKIKEEDFRID